MFLEADFELGADHLGEHKWWKLLLSPYVLKPLGVCQLFCKHIGTFHD
jgi:hypothetical protein